MKIETVKMTDVSEPEFVEIIIREDGTVVWINVDGVCLFRACHIKHVILKDHQGEEDRK